MARAVSVALGDRRSRRLGVVVAALYLLVYLIALGDLLCADAGAGGRGAACRRAAGRRGLPVPGRAAGGGAAADLDRASPGAGRPGGSARLNLGVAAIRPFLRCGGTCRRTAAPWRPAR